ncbi:hypothetical protein MKW98_005897 [Papaver atlanticum]|uniref:Uncharacterized protein n=1 Tax=Papaver atlanticum TaxID=357466 RepID=A0AAD4TDP9_9MAGN|nr:hypothetical protein MKW98_005897 [Papaver atlanticum]
MKRLLILESFLATVAPAYGCKYYVVIPDDAAIEKAQILRGLQNGVSCEKTCRKMDGRVDVANVAHLTRTETSPNSTFTQLQTFFTASKFGGCARLIRHTMQVCRRYQGLLCKCSWDTK